MNDEPTEITEYDIQIWKNSEGRRHRDDDLPALIHPNGYYSWWQNDKRHRDNDLPAEIWSDGRCQWRVDGP